MIGGDDAWRWGFIAASFPTLVIGVIVFFVKDPPRGQFEQRSALGETLDDLKPGPISLSAAFQRLFKVKTMKSTLMAAVALGFGLISDGLFLSLYLEDRFQLDAFERALVGSTPGVLALVMIPYVAKCTTPSTPLPAESHGPARLAVLPDGALDRGPALDADTGNLRGDLGSQSPLRGTGRLAAVSHPGQRQPLPHAGAGSAIGSALVFGVGGLGGAILMGLVSDATSPRTALLAIVPWAMIGGGLFIVNGARHIRSDLSQGRGGDPGGEGRKRPNAGRPRRHPGAPAPEHRLLLWHGASALEVDLEVARGETLALLGTNGAGKSTALRVAAGLAIPSEASCGSMAGT